MLLKINGPKSVLWQWDLNQQLVVDDTVCGEVHFCNGTTDCALVCEVYERDGLRLVDVPNILLQSANRLTAYLCIGDRQTLHQQTFPVVARNKPDDYVYTETEVKRWEALERRVLDLIRDMEEAKASGELKGDPGPAGPIGVTGAKGERGDAFKYEDFTPEQLEALRGPQGPKGDTGESGVVAPVTGFFSLMVDDDGGLWAISEEENELAFEYDAETGALYVVQEV